MFSVQKLRECSALRGSVILSEAEEPALIRSNRSSPGPHLLENLFFE
jgi:hypothetical protein